MPSRRFTLRPACLLGLLLLALAAAYPTPAALAADVAADSSAPAGETQARIATRPGVTVNALLLLPPGPEKPKAAVIFFPGDKGDIGVGGDEQHPTLKKGGNFLVRSRRAFVARGLAVLVPDAPSDQPGGMSPQFRFSDENVADIAALVAFLKQRTGLTPWLSGTSMGAISASFAGVRLKDAVSGLVLSSSVTRVSRKWDMPPLRVRGALDAGLENLRVPVLVVRHRDDACSTSPPDNGARMLEALWNAPKKELLTFEGGKTPESGPCEAKSQHGYFGIEDEVVEGICGFILRNQPAR